MSISADEQKRAAAARAAGLVSAGMKVGLGTGSTAAHLIRILGERAGEGLEITCVATSEAAADLAREAGLTLGALDELLPLDITIDGADELDEHLRLIKGGGGAHLREKIVASASKRMVVIADESKLVETLGAYPLAVEIVRFGVEATREALFRALQAAGRSPSMGLRMTPDTPFVTDEGHYIIDCACGAMDDPAGLAATISDIPGVVEHGLFIGIATDAIIGRANGEVTLLGGLAGDGAAEAER